MFLSNNSNLSFLIIFIAGCSSDSNLGEVKEPKNSVIEKSNETVNKYPTNDEDSVYYYFNKKQIQENDGIISSEPVDELSYDFIRNNYEFIGKWKMKWTLDVLKGNKEPILEFYLSDSPDFWFQVYTENTMVIKKLIKEGDKYTRKPESQQDYYLITKKGELRSYDDNGYIGPEAGFKYVKMK